MKSRKVVQSVHEAVKDFIYPGDWVIDATAGGGYDTLFLAQCVGKEGRVFSFDVQPQALQRTEIRLQENQAFSQVTLVLQGHETMQSYFTDALPKLRGCMFNLGYLPNGNKSIITQSSTTLEALNFCKQFILEKNHGWLSIVTYPGHSGGDDESAAVHSWLQNLQSTTSTHSLTTISSESPSGPLAFILLPILKQ